MTYTDHSTLTSFFMTPHKDYEGPSLLDDNILEEWQQGEGELDMSIDDMEKNLLENTAHDTSGQSLMMPSHQKEICSRRINEQITTNMNTHTVIISRGKPPVKHPLTNTPVVLSKINDVDSTNPSQGSFYDRCWQNVLTFRWMSISGGSKTTYQSGWNKWKPFTEEFGTNLTLTIIPPEWTLSPIPSLTFSECAITAYMAYLQDKNLLPKTIFTYVLGSCSSLRI